MNLNIEELVQNAIDGIEDPLKAYAIITDINKTSKKALDQIKDLALNEAEKHGGKTFESDGFIFEKRAGGRSWSFKGIEEVEKKEQELKDVKEKYKLAFSSREKGMDTYDPESGAELDLPTVIFRSDSLIVKQ